jgi:two-component system LytT family response regulator
VIRDILRFEPDIEIIGTATGGREAIESINELAPDLVFLDVQMPEVDGFEVVSRIKLPRIPVIIFVTGHDDYALKAFEAHAMDYLIKPCQVARLRSAVDRARQQIQNHRNGDIQQKLDSLMEDLKADTKYPDRLAVKSNGRIVFLRLSEIDMVEAADNYVKLYVGSETHMLRETLTALEEKLPPDLFVRISRSTIVNIESIKELHPMFHGEYAVGLSGATPATGRDHVGCPNADSARPPSFSL